MSMDVHNLKHGILRGVEGETLDAKFLSEVQHGLNCSPFEAEAILELVKEVYFPFIDEQSAEAPAVKITLAAVSADEPTGKPVAECEKRSVCLTIHRGDQDDRILQEQGPAGFRQARILDICQEALSQSALLTREDLASRVFFVSPRTITRDLQSLRARMAELVIPLRGAVRDVGPMLTYGTQVVRLALEGKTRNEICQIMHHCLQAVNNYLSTFVRCVQLSRHEVDVEQIVYLLRQGRALIQQYLDIAGECHSDARMTYYLDELLRSGTRTVP